MADLLRYYIVEDRTTGERRVVGTYSRQELHTMYPPDRFKLASPTSFVSLDAAFDETAKLLGATADQLATIRDEPTTSRPKLSDAVAEQDGAKERKADNAAESDTKRVTSAPDHSTTPRADIPVEVRSWGDISPHARDVKEVLRDTGRFGGDRSAPVYVNTNNETLDRTSLGRTESPPQRPLNISDIVRRGVKTTAEVHGAEGTHFKLFKYLSPSDKAAGTFQMHQHAPDFGVLKLQPKTVGVIEHIFAKGEVSTPQEARELAVLHHEGIHAMHSKIVEKGRGGFRFETSFRSYATPRTQFMEEGLTEALTHKGLRDFATKMGLQVTATSISGQVYKHEVWAIQSMAEAVERRIGKPQVDTLRKLHLGYIDSGAKVVGFAKMMTSRHPRLIAATNMGRIVKKTHEFLDEIEQIKATYEKFSDADSLREEKYYLEEAKSRFLEGVAKVRSARVVRSTGVRLHEPVRDYSYVYTEPDHSYWANPPEDDGLPWRPAEARWRRRYLQSTGFSIKRAYGDVLFDRIARLAEAAEESRYEREALARYEAQERRKHRWSLFRAGKLPYSRVTGFRSLKLGDTGLRPLYDGPLPNPEGVLLNYVTQSGINNHLIDRGRIGEYGRLLSKYGSGGPQIFRDLVGYYQETLRDAAALDLFAKPLKRDLVVHRQVIEREYYPSNYTFLSTTHGPDPGTGYVNRYVANITLPKGTRVIDIRKYYEHPQITRFAQQQEILVAPGQTDKIRYEFVRAPYGASERALQRMQLMHDFARKLQGVRWRSRYQTEFPPDRYSTASVHDRVARPVDLSWRPPNSDTEAWLRASRTVMGLFGSLGKLLGVEPPRTQTPHLTHRSYRRLSPTNRFRQLYPWEMTSEAYINELTRLNWSTSVEEFQHNLSYRWKLAEKLEHNWLGKSPLPFSRALGYTPRQIRDFTRYVYLMTGGLEAFGKNNENLPYPVEFSTPREWAAHLHKSIVEEATRQGLIRGRPQTQPTVTHTPPTRHDRPISVDVPAASSGQAAEIAAIQARRSSMVHRVADLDKNLWRKRQYPGPSDGVAGAEPKTSTPDVPARRQLPHKQWLPAEVQASTDQSGASVPRSPEVRRPAVGQVAPTAVERKPTHAEISEAIRQMHQALGTSKQPNRVASQQSIEEALRWAREHSTIQGPTPTSQPTGDRIGSGATLRERQDQMTTPPRELIISGTGHRPQRLGGYGEPVYRRLVTLAGAALDNLKPTHVVSGMALGWDQALAEAAYQRGIPFTAAVPFQGQESQWPASSQAKYRDLLSKADRVQIVSEGGYSAWKMQRRNEWMVRNSNLVIALWDGSPSGTSHAVEAAKRVGRQVVNLWPFWSSGQLPKIDDRLTRMRRRLNPNLIVDPLQGVNTRLVNAAQIDTHSPQRAQPEQLRQTLYTPGVQQDVNTQMQAAADQRHLRDALAWAQQQSQVSTPRPVPPARVLEPTVPAIEAHSRAVLGVIPEIVRGGLGQAVLGTAIHSALTQHEQGKGLDPFTAAAEGVFWTAVMARPSVAGVAMTMNKEAIQDARDMAHTLATVGVGAVGSTIAERAAGMVGAMRRMPATGIVAGQALGLAAWTAAPAIASVLLPAVFHKFKDEAQKHVAMSKDFGVAEALAKGREYTLSEQASTEFELQFYDSDDNELELDDDSDDSADVDEAYDDDSGASLTMETMTPTENPFAHQQTIGVF